MYWVAFVIPLVVIVAGLVFWAARRGPVASLAITGDAELSATAGRRTAGARIRLILLIVPTVGGVLVAFVVASYQDADGIDGPLGRTSFLMISPLWVTIIMVLLMGFVPRLHEVPVRRMADLSRRSPLTFVDRPAMLVGIVLASLLVIATITFGVLAWPHTESLFYFYGGGFAGGGGEFPGFGFGVPILVSVVLLVAAVWVSLFRVAGASRPTDDSLRNADAVIRLLTSAAIVAIGSFAVALSLAIVLLMAGVSFWDVADPKQDWTGAQVAVSGTAQALAILSHTGVGFAGGLFVLSIYFLVRAVSFASRSPFGIVSQDRPSETVDL